MSKPSDSMPVYAIVSKTNTNVICASHPTEAKNSNYQPPFRQNFIADPNRKDYSLQHVGAAFLKEDGNIRIELIDIPLSKTLIIEQSKT